MSEKQLQIQFGTKLLWPLTDDALILSAGRSGRLYQWKLASIVNLTKYFGFPCGFSWNYASPFVCYFARCENIDRIIQNLNNNAESMANTVCTFYPLSWNNIWLNVYQYKIYLSEMKIWFTCVGLTQYLQVHFSCGVNQFRFIILRLIKLLPWKIIAKNNQSVQSFILLQLINFGVNRNAEFLLHVDLVFFDEALQCFATLSTPLRTV